MVHTCPLCHKDVATAFVKRKSRDFYHCSDCGLISIPPHQYLSPADEKARYLTHENDPHDPNYRNFLNQVFLPLRERLRPGMEGLDYGSGPGPTLSVMFRESGLTMTEYDPFFANEPARLERSYDFITCTETAEHFFRPGDEFAKLHRLLKPGGWLGVLTQTWSTLDAFPNWYYPNDPSHVVFYHPQTFAWIAKRFGWQAELVSQNCVLFSRP